jgi:hypothetical protein
VEGVGGVLLDSYEDASDLAEQVNYPPETQGLYPAAKGTFAEQKIEGLAIYVPVREVVA